jgi:hypothetical protein
VTPAEDGGDAQAVPATEPESGPEGDAPLEPAASSDDETAPDRPDGAPSPSAFPDVQPQRGLDDALDFPEVRGVEDEG